MFDPMPPSAPTDALVVPLIARPIISVSLVDEVLARVEAAIMAGQLAPGTRLREQALARDLSVSRGAVREALRRLEGRGLVERTTNIGIRIASLSDKAVIENLQIWQSLGTLAAKLCATEADESVVARLRALIASLRSEVSLRQIFDTYHKFNVLLAEASGNARLCTMFTGLLDVMHLYRSHLMTLPDTKTDMARLTRELDLLVDAIARKEPEAASTIMHAHVGSNLDFHLRHREGQLQRSA